jgi:hypothetical protein
MGLAAMALVAGCGGGGGGDGTEVKGRVTFDGAPVADGAINLLPLEAEGARASMPITDGEYVFPADKGLKPGKYRVEIFAFEPIPGSGGGGGDEDSEAESQTRQIVPPKFNNESTLELEVTEDGVEKNWELTSN